MCIAPLKILNNSKTISIDCSPLYRYVPCGQCCDCEARKHDDYLVRSFAQYNKTLSQGGFQLFETFTYRNSQLPHFGILSRTNYPDFRKVQVPVVTDTHALCFNSRHYRKFMVELRHRISRYNYLVPALDENGNQILYKSSRYKDGIRLYKKGDPKFIKFYPYKLKDGNLKVFWVSEFGDDTQRPHYHANFYCTVEGLSPVMLQEFIRLSWHYGRIDEETSLYEKLNVRNHNLYLFKYVTKQLSYYEKIINFYQKNFRRYGDSIRDFNHFEKVYRHRFPFHRQSNGFGEELTFLSGFTSDLQSVKIGDSVYKIPIYNLRKMFYSLETDSYGKHWRLTSAGLTWKLSNLDSLIQSTSDKYHNFVTNYYDFSGFLDSKYLRQNVNKYLGSRTWIDFAVYVIVFKDKLYNQHLPVDYRDFYISQFDYNNYENVYDNFLPRSVAYVDRGDFRLYKPRISNSFKSISLSDISTNLLISEDTCQRFKDFDKLYNLLALYMVEFNRYRQDLSISINKLKTKFYESSFITSPI